MEAHEIRLPVAGTPAAARDARRQLALGIRTAWGDLLDRDLLDTVELAAGELIANAVRHAGGGPIWAGARLDDAGLLLDVTDSASDGRLPQVALPDPEAEGGRGLFLVAALADLHGCDQLPSGKRCWAQFKVGAPFPAIPSRLPSQRS
ncbi:ATP-binding protein [Streptomyces beihaiensis]|uniref:ATP-binding protein n=1 Tax=Streptomyces beihaiensis TaxID=2984495 RepID=A0ABT3TRX6_9ACTN|nr:ATP-binding protein [Streptomyces beihaiensis]MCX3059797.1 ATP-binding protein [Streptomyces beihaiensis]